MPDRADGRACALREAPATVPALGALALMVVWATDQAGYPLTHWAPGGLIVLALLAIALRGGARRAGRRSRPAVRVAVGCLAAYTALSFLSILWAGVPGDAWEGANRTLLYLLVFALFACWAQRGATAALLLCAWTLAMSGRGAVHGAARRRRGGQRGAPDGAAAGGPAGVPGGVRERERGAVADGLSGRRCCWRASGGCRGGCGERWRAARCCSPRWRCSARAAARCTRAGDAGAGVRAAPRPRAHVRAAGPGRGGDRRGGAGGAARGRPGERAGRRVHGAVGPAQPGGPAQRDGRGPRRRGGDAAQRARGRRGGGGGGGAGGPAHALAGRGGARAPGRRRGRGGPAGGAAGGRLGGGGRPGDAGAPRVGHVQEPARATPPTAPRAAA